MSKCANRRIGNKKASATVVLAMVFVAFSVCITSAIMIARALVVKSECLSFGNIWCRAVLSEYDRYLLDEYGIMAFFGSDDLVSETLSVYADYSMTGSLGVTGVKAKASLTGCELGNPDNFRKALNRGEISLKRLSELNGKRLKRKQNDNGDSEAASEDNNRIINNRVVLDTLPSCGIQDASDSEDAANRIKCIDTSDGLAAEFMKIGAETILIMTCFGNKVTLTEKSRDNYLRNEWEYILFGKNSDRANYKACRERLFLIRNALNLAFIYQDPEKMSVVIAAAELITPGAGVISQALIAELWAAAESESDIRILEENGRVPFAKTAISWRTDLVHILGSSESRRKLGKEAIRTLEDNADILGGGDNASDSSADSSIGQSYEDYLLAMLMVMNDDVRLLRIMDLIQINMKFRHYRDFNMMEYYTGVRFVITAGRKSYEFEDCYK